MTLSRLLVGGFSAEDEWGGTDRIRLSPWRASAESTESVAAGMSELLGVLAGPRDRVGVLAQPDETLSDNYRRRFGHEVQWTLCPVYANGPSALSLIQPFAVTARLAEYFAQTGQRWPFPSLETIRRVNSKSWSHEVRTAFMRSDATWAESAEQVSRAARERLSRGPVVIKEDFGVSGKGNCVVRELPQLQSLVRLIEQQERAGKHGGFVIEPLFDKLVDFSGHFTVHSDGRTSFDGFRRMLNVGHRYVASFALPDHIQQRLRAGSYFKEVETVLAALVKEQYFGPVCIDGLMLCDGSVVSTLEVNARTSMGRLSLALGDSAVLFTLRVRAEGERPFARVMAELNRRKLTERLLLLGGSTSDLRWYGAYWFSEQADPASDIAELISAAKACGVEVDSSFPAKALSEHIAQLRNPLVQEQPVARSA